jgi:hypothetical protein
MPALPASQATPQRTFGPVARWPERRKRDFQPLLLTICSMTGSTTFPCCARPYKPNIDWRYDCQNGSRNALLVRHCLDGKGTEPEHQHRRFIRRQVCTKSGLRVVSWREREKDDEIIPCHNKLPLRNKFVNSR